MSKDIKHIQKSLKNYIEVSMPYTFKRNEKIKYITNKNGEELFYEGGEYVKMGNEKINLRNGSNTWYVPTKIRDNNNNVIYTSRFFVNISNDKKIDNNIQEYIKIINTQQKVIEKLTLALKNTQKELNKHK